LAFISLDIDRLLQEASFQDMLSSTRIVTNVGSSIFLDISEEEWVTPAIIEYNEPII
jgi:hypothetical protein